MGYVLFALLCVLLLVLRHVARRSEQQPPHPAPPAVIPAPAQPPVQWTASAPYWRPRELEPPPDHLDLQLQNVSRPGVVFATRRVMNGGEWDTFCAGLNVNGQPVPRGAYPYYMFPQVALGQVLKSNDDDAHKAINSRRCDLLIADRFGNTVAVVEYQGGGHNKDGKAPKRDKIKRIALEKAGVLVVEIADGSPVSAIESAIRGALASKQGRAGYGHESHVVH